jgi:DNA helicase-2/ATP-dependent DNA helicase PcrA
MMAVIQLTNLFKLNENQREAVEWSKGPLLVLAGPGSGKTLVLSMRVARIIEQFDGEHFHVLGLTFTNKAATEMLERVNNKIGTDQLRRVRLTTFHSFASELLRQHGNHIGIKPDFTIISDDTDREELVNDVLNDILKDLSIFVPAHFMEGSLLPAITKYLEDVAVAGQPSINNNFNLYDNLDILSLICKKYRDSLQRINALDFPSLLSELMYLLNKYPIIVNNIRKVYKHILIDEFQDTNLIQYKILSHIVSPDPSTLFVVADDDQIIYEWNGASTKRLAELRNDFEPSQLQLPENYRCPDQVVYIANSLIQNNQGRSAGKIPSVPGKTLRTDIVNGNADESVRVFLPFASLDDEASWIAFDIVQRPEDERINCAVLARTTKLINKVADKMAESGLIPYLARRQNEFQSAPLRMLHSIMRLVNSKEDKKSLSCLIKAFFDIENEEFDSTLIVSRASANGQDLLRSWLEEVKFRNSIDSQTKDLLENGIKPLLDTLNYSDFAGKLFSWAEQRLSSKHLREEDAFNEFKQEKIIWNTFINNQKNKFFSEKVSLHQFLQELSLFSKEPPKPKGAIPCFTIHASKGLEFGHVYLMGLTEDLLPSWFAVRKGDTSFAMQEERRSCFVAITRAQKSLTMTCSRQAFGYSKKPSRFLKEMGYSL